MSAEDDATQNVCVTLRNLLNSVQCVTGRVRDGESNESDGDFNLSNFWDTLNQAVKAVSQEATKVSLVFSKPPLPSQQDGEQLADSVLKSVLSLSTVYYWLPKSQGVSLRQQVRDATVQVLEGLTQLLEVILSSPLQSLTQEQLTSTGGVWAACDRFTHLPQDNKAAVLLVLTGQSGIVKDAIEELEQALSEAHDPFGDVLGDEEDGEEPRGNRDTYWSERDRRVVAACRGMMKAAAACLRKMTAAVRVHGDADAPQRVAQLDDLVDGVKEISPQIDDLALCLYPPVDYNSVENDVSKLAALLKKVLAIIRSSHICGEAELTWVQFLDGAVDHNLQKAKDLIRLDS
ncbi:cyclin-D1-binding protein 1 homolog isoform X1 [Phyllopteryx taeniolatus]|uniref:cyclin-D1-binding protein 1 homolog isoform X1 n=1 Tax=Phyllopteryx taeniolatus TaxID=161469 RepID=UPI002AD31E98|nr:cyclin-D1-binding protein 1 homolog isoform X1 [Phyllopteryx taeniolatus]